MKAFLTKLFKIPQCKYCGSWDLTPEWSCWARGWNNLCDQATGDNGRMCNNCIRINWTQSLDDYKKTLPDWCKAYESQK